MEKSNMDAQFQIELSEGVAQGIYSNFTVITHSSSEVILDFVRVLPGVPKASVKSRVILAPEHAKRLMLALQENIRKYEAKYDTIQLYNEELLPPISPLKGEA